MVARKTDVFKTPTISIPSSSAKIGASGLDPALTARSAGLKKVSDIAKSIEKTEKAQQIARTKSAFKALTDTINNQVSGALDVTARQTPLSPGEIQSVGIDIIEDAANMLPPQSRPAFRAKYRTDLANKVATSNDNVIKIEQSKATEKAKIRKAQINGKMIEASTGRFSPNPELKMSADRQVQTIFEDAMAEMGEQGVDFEGKAFPLFTEAQKAERFIELRNLSLGTGLFESFINSPDKPRAIREFDRGDVRFDVPDPNDPKKTINMDARDILGGSWTGLRTKMSQLLSSEKDVRGIDERNEEKAAAIGRRENYKRDLFSLDPSNTERDPITRKGVLTAPPGTYNASDAEKLLTAIDNFGTITKKDDDEVWTLALQTMLDNGERIEDVLLESTANPDVVLSQETFLKFQKADQALADELSGVTAGPEKSALAHQRSMLGDAYDPVGRFGAIDRSQARKRNQAWDEYDQAVLDARKQGLEGRDMIDFAREKRLELELRIPGPRAKNILPKRPIGMEGAREITIETLSIGLDKLEILNQQGIVTDEEYWDEIIEYDRLTTKVLDAENRAKLNANTGASGRGFPERKSRRGQ